jgi:hypothetical protein
VIFVNQSLIFVKFDFPTQHFLYFFNSNVHFMKKITLLLVAILCTLTGYSQYFEGFEGATFPPTGWLVTDNGVGTTFSWDKTGPTTPPPYEGEFAAFMTRENIGIGNTSQDWLITNQITVPANGQLKFFTRST